MKPSALLFLLFSFYNGHAQNQSHLKIKILLLGCSHFTPSSQDMHKGEGVNAEDPKRKQEIKEVVDRLIRFQPDQVCIEVEPSRQLRMDTLYQQFLRGQYKLASDEIDQLAFPVAQKLRLKKLTCINYLGRFDPDPVSQYAQNNGQSAIMTELNVYGRKSEDEKKKANRYKAY